ncbi:hypothetical protein HY480_00500 [Candidatus Uhrbacteria bacterium]|nr:hypothetical protein [Candidatus Uhrbacteria bacterium]
MANALAQINFASPTWDLFILLFFLAFSLLYGFSLGRDRIIVIIVGIYMALAVVNTAPWIRALEGTAVDIALGKYFAFQVTLFLGVFLLTFFLLSRSALMGTIGVLDVHGSIFQVMIFSVLHVGLLVSVTLSFLPSAVAQQFAPVTRAVFISELGRFLWIVLPIVAMVFTRRPKSARRET